VVLTVDEMTAALIDADDLLALVAEEEDEVTAADLIRDLERCEQRVGGLEFRRMFSGPMDDKNAFGDTTVPCARARNKRA